MSVSRAILPGLIEPVAKDRFYLGFVVVGNFEVIFFARHQSDAVLIEPVDFGEWNIDVRLARATEMQSLVTEHEFTRASTAEFPVNRSEMIGACR